MPRKGKSVPNYRYEDNVEDGKIEYGDQQLQEGQDETGKVEASIGFIGVLGQVDRVVVVEVIVLCVCGFCGLTVHYV